MNAEVLQQKKLQKNYPVKNVHISSTCCRIYYQYLDAESYPSFQQQCQQQWKVESKANAFHSKQVNRVFEVQKVGRYLWVFPIPHVNKAEITKVLDISHTQYWIVPDSTPLYKAVIGDMESVDPEKVKYELIAHGFDMTQITQNYDENCYIDVQSGCCSGKGHIGGQLEQRTR